MKKKLKTKKAAAKRYKVTGTGKIMRESSGLKHLLEHKRSKSKRSKQGVVEVAKTEIKKIKRMIPGI